MCTLPKPRILLYLKCFIVQIPCANLEQSWFIFKLRHSIKNPLKKNLTGHIPNMGQPRRKCMKGKRKSIMNNFPTSVVTLTTWSSPGSPSLLNVSSSILIHRRE